MGIGFWSLCMGQETRLRGTMTKARMLKTDDAMVTLKPINHCKLMQPQTKSQNGVKSSADRSFANVHNGHNCG